MDMVNNVIGNVIATLVVAALGWAAARGRLAWNAWQARPSAQARQEDDMEAARRIAGNTQRLVLLLGAVTIMMLGFGALAGFTLTLGWGLSHGFPLYSGVATGLFLGMALLCRYALQQIDNVQVALKEEEDRRLAATN